MNDESFSRRTFLQAQLGLQQQIGSALSQSAAGTQPSGSPFRTASKLRKISENLFVLEDTCNVYLWRDGTHGLLIDFGSGAILDQLRDTGVSAIDWVLHTHHHRDQAQGDGVAASRGIPIAVPSHERHLFENAERFWQSRRVNDLYNVRNDFFSLTFNVPVAQELRDYETFDWRGHQIGIRPAPGHTPGSIAMLADIDGRRALFSGDLMHSPGKVQTLYDLQYYYAEHEGVDFAEFSLRDLIRLKPQLLCPSHGKELFDPVPGMTQTADGLAEWFRFWHPGGTRPTSHLTPIEVTPQLLAHPEATSTFYALISKSGKALFIDYGCASWTFFQALISAIGEDGRMRFIEHGLALLRERYGMKQIDVAIASHMHDDHLNGFNHLSKHHGTKLWCFENNTRILENPRERNLGCTFGEPLRVDRSIRNGETFHWEEFEFHAIHSPGHTNYQMALLTTVGGKRIAFTGDAIFADREGRQLRHNLIYRNDVKIGDYHESLRNILSLKPDILAPGHGEPFPLRAEAVGAFRKRLDRQDALMATLAAAPEVDSAMDPSSIQIRPYQIVASPGKPILVEVFARNHHEREIKVDAAMVMPKGWTCEPPSVRFIIAAKGNASARVRVVPPLGGPASPRFAIALDVVADGAYVGQVAEAIVRLA